jgi:3',5'-cyclic AMP phosphodiesterase CpdA
VLIAQVTDTHITSDGAQAAYLTAALAFIASLEPQPAAVVMSGDLADSGRPHEYALLRDILARCALPVYVVPGNHDRRGPLRAALPEAYYPGTSGEHLNYTIETAPVRLVALDSSKPRRSGGFLDDAALAWLDATLTQAPVRPTLLFLHHPPFRTGVNAADLLGFHGLHRLHAIVARHPALRRIVAGHIHCERSATIGRALATTSISSAPQHVPELFERHILGLRSEPAGFALHAWNADAFTSTTYVNIGGGRFIERAAARAAT